MYTPVTRSPSSVRRGGARPGAKGDLFCGSEEQVGTEILGSSEIQVRASSRTQTATCISRRESSTRFEKTPWASKPEQQNSRNVPPPFVPLMPKIPNGRETSPTLPPWLRRLGSSGISCRGCKKRTLLRRASHSKCLSSELDEKWRRVALSAIKYKCVLEITHSHSHINLNTMWRVPQGGGLDILEGCKTGGVIAYGEHFKLIADAARRIVVSCETSNQCVERVRRVVTSFTRSPGPYLYFSKTDGGSLRVHRTGRPSLPCLPPLRAGPSCFPPSSSVGPQRERKKQAPAVEVNPRCQ